MQFLIKPFQTPYLHFTLIVVCIFLFFLYFWIKRLMWLFRQLRRKWNVQPFQPELLKYYKNAVWFWSFFLFLGLILVGFAYYLTTYQYIGKKVDAAGQARFRAGRVDYLGFDERRLSVPVRGFQVAACGVFMRFPKWMSFLGLGSYHRMITFRGNSQHEYHYGKLPDPQWLRSFVDYFFYFGYKNRDWFGIADFTYKESVYFPPGTHRVMITRDGYIIQ